MARLNDHYLKLEASYLFPKISRRIAEFRDRHPRAELIALGIGDVVLPLPAAVRAAMRDAVEELGTEEGFRGYPPYEGYDFLREAIARRDFAERGCDVSPDEIFVSDGSKCDAADIQEIFAVGARVAVTDPGYPVYVDTTVMAGRTGPAADGVRYEGVVYLPCTEESGFLPAPPDESVDLVYLCSPNNPTGATVDRAALGRWVDWARERDAVLLFDAAYEAYISDPELPHSIFEIPGARQCAVELRSFSKSASFTGVRCAYTAVPRELEGTTQGGGRARVHDLWSRRYATKSNGVSYPVQRGAAATYTDQGRREVRANVAYYMENARRIREGLTELGLRVFGGHNAPYLWVKTPDGVGSWEFFERLLERAHVIGTPGAGFGACGEGYLRLSAFGKRDRIEEAVARIRRGLAS